MQNDEIKNTYKKFEKISKKIKKLDDNIISVQASIKEMIDEMASKLDSVVDTFKV